jgi:hypothetical protein
VKECTRCNGTGFVLHDMTLFGMSACEKVLCHGCFGLGAVPDPPALTLFPPRVFDATVSLGETEH